MIITRIYKNSSDVVIRSDEITVSISPPTPVLLPRIGNDKGLLMVLGPRKVKSTKVFCDNMIIDSIELVGDIDDYEPSSGSFAWASKILGNAQIVKFDMSDLPVIGESAA